MKERLYIICFNKYFGNMSKVGDLLNDLQIIDDWRSDLPNACYLKSKENATKIAIEINKLVDKNSKFFISEITDNNNGFITDETWKFLSNSDELKAV